MAASDALRTASKRFGDFFARVPAADVSRARNAVAHLKAADASKDGVIDDAEFYAAPLSAEEQLAATWGVWGTTLYSADLRAAVGSQFILQIKKPPDVPDELKIGLLEGGLPRAKLVALMDLLQTRRDQTHDAKLEAALDEVETRAAVELAKFS